VVSVLGPARSADGPAWSPSQLPPEHCSGTALRFLHPRMSAPNAPPHASTSGTIIGEGPCTPRPLRRHSLRVQKCTHARESILGWHRTRTSRASLHPCTAFLPCQHLTSSMCTQVTLLLWLLLSTLAEAEEEAVGVGAVAPVNSSAPRAARKPGFAPRAARPLPWRQPPQ
jgi:hypothetical protein